MRTTRMGQWLGMWACIGTLSIVARGADVAPAPAKTTEPAAASPAVPTSDAEKRLAADVAYLASDALEGRGIETAGIRKAADFIRDRFASLGLKPGAADGSYFQPFTVRLASQLDTAHTSMTLLGPDGQEVPLTIGKDFQPLAFGSEGEFKAPVVFAGYGISADDLQYDDYKGVDVAGKVVVVMRRRPQQAKKGSRFDGDAGNKHGGLIPKVQTAWSQRAAAILFVTDPFTASKPEDDKLVAVNYVPSENAGNLPVAHVTQGVVNRMLTGTPLGNLNAAESRIDQNLTPVSAPLTGWTIKGTFRFERRNADLNNVVGVLPGEGPNAEETIVVGGHYDHLGRGGVGSGSLTPDTHDIHNGADDNASGTAAVLELARRYASRPTPPSRRLVFIAFSGEERGLLGSRHYVKKDPRFPLANTVAMINFDMVGRLKNDSLIAYGTGTAKEFDAALEAANAPFSFKLKKTPDGGGPSDHASFYAADIPVFHLFTGVHGDYHRPSDDVDKVNVPGMKRIVDLTERMIDSLLAMPTRPTFVKVASSDPHAGMTLSGGGDLAYLGTVPDYGEDVEGVLLNDIKAGSPAEKGGLKPGDIIVNIAGAPIRNVNGLTLALRKHKPKEVVTITVLRDKKNVELTVTLGSR